jgi:hypothetical protein
MLRYAYQPTLIALLTLALWSFAAASPAPAARLDPARVFNPASESLFAGVERPSHASPIVVSLFYEREEGIPALTFAAAAPEVASVNVVPEITLHAYAPDALPAAPLSLPSVTPAVRAPRLDARIAAPPQVQIAAPAVDVHFGDYAPYLPTVQDVAGSVQVPLRVGSVHFSGTLRGSQFQTEHADAIRAMQLCGTTDEGSACPYLHDESQQRLAAATDFNVRTGKTRVDLQLAGTVGITNNFDASTGMYPYTPLQPDSQPNVLAPSVDGSLLYYPGLADLVEHGLAARIAVPVSPALTLGLQYASSHYQGDYGALLAPGLDAYQNTYLGNITYQLPHSSSLITFSARQYRYQDTYSPSFNLSETRADLNFTVKF